MGSKGEMDTSQSRCYDAIGDDEVTVATPRERRRRRGQRRRNISAAGRRGQPAGASGGAVAVAVAETGRCMNQRPRGRSTVVGGLECRQAGQSGGSTTTTGTWSACVGSRTNETGGCGEAKGATDAWRMWYAGNVQKGQGELRSDPGRTLPWWAPKDRRETCAQRRLAGRRQRRGAPAVVVVQRTRMHQATRTCKTSGRVVNPRALHTAGGQANVMAMHATCLGTTDVDDDLQTLACPRRRPRPLCRHGTASDCPHQ
jgi:hypothetical protein